VIFISDGEASAAVGGILRSKAGLQLPLGRDYDDGEKKGFNYNAGLVYSSLFIL
jgi:hypothetical protein